MAYTNFIAAIDLGSSHLVGMVGFKNENGTLSVIAHETESAATCIRRGCVYNVDETANKVKRLVRKLENKLQGATIGKVYVGVGGQSLRTFEHVVPKMLGAEGVVTEEIIDSLYKECLEYQPDLLDVLAIVSPAYYLDGKHEVNPVGIPCNRIEARYKLIVGRPSLKRYIRNSITERAKIEIADILVSPLSLADAVLTEDEKDLGCALIGFGAGVTSLAVYKAGQLVNLTVIPFGGNLITKDLTTLNLVEAEAERIKKTYGSAIPDKENDTMIQVNSSEGMGLRQVALNEINMVVEARIQEILENVLARLEETGLMNHLGAGIVITGGASALKQLPELIRNRTKMDVRFASLRKQVLDKNDFNSTNPEYATAISLLLKGNENCAAPPVIVEAPKVVEPELPKPEPEIIKPPKKKGPGLIDRLGGFVNDLFDDKEDR